MHKHVTCNRARAAEIGPPYFRRKQENDHSAHFNVRVHKSQMNHPEFLYRNSVSTFRGLFCQFFNWNDF